MQTKEHALKKDALTFKYKQDWTITVFNISFKVRLGKLHTIISQ